VCKIFALPVLTVILVLHVLLLIYIDKKRYLSKKSSHSYDLKFVLFLIVVCLILLITALAPLIHYIVVSGEKWIYTFIVSVLLFFVLFVKKINNAADKFWDFILSNNPPH